MVELAGYWVQLEVRAQAFAYHRPDVVRVVVELLALSRSRDQNGRCVWLAAACYVLD